MADTSTITPSESPSSFSDLPASAWQESGADAASGAGSQPAETPTADATSAPSPEGATVPPAETPREGADGTRQQSGPIPFDRHEAILKAERDKSAAMEAKWQRVAWAEKIAESGLSAEQVQQALEIVNGLDQYPAEFLERYYERIVADPRYAPQVRSWAGRVLGGGRSQPDEDPEPQPVYFEGTDPTTGQRGRFLTEQYLRDREAWLTRQQERKLDAKIAPLVQDKQQREHREQTLAAANQLYRQEWDRTQSDLTKLRALPHFEENKADIKAYLVQNGYKPSLHEAYNHVLVTKVLPTLSQTEKAKTLAELRTQAAASGTRPKSAVAATPGPTPKNFRDLPPEAWKD